MAKKYKIGDVFCFYLNEEGYKGYARVLDYVGPRKRIPCIELYRLTPRAELYSLDEIKKAPVLRRITGGGTDWEYIGNIPVKDEDVPQFYWRWYGRKALKPIPDKYTNFNVKLFCLARRADHLPLGVDYTNKQMVAWDEARLQIEDSTHTHISAILAFIRQMKDENMITEEVAEFMREYVKKYYMGLLIARAKPQPIKAEKLFIESDVAADVKEMFSQHMRKKRDVEKATNAVLAELGEELVQDLDDGPIVYLALAILHAKKKQIVPMIRERALDIIEKRIGIERWEDAGADVLKEHLELREAIKEYIEKVDVK